MLTQHSSGWKLILKRLTSTAFGQPFLCIGVLYLIMQWGEFDNMTIHMISIFSESKSSIDPEFAPVFVSCIMVKILNDIHIHHKNVLCSSSRDFIIITIPGWSHACSLKKWWLVILDRYFKGRMENCSVCEKVKKRKGFWNISQKPCVHTVKGQTNKRYL